MKNYRQKLRSLLSAEKNLSKEGGRNSGGILRVCLVSPSGYRTGMSSLGFQKVYSLLASFPDLFCDRAFLPDPEDIRLFRSGRGEILSIESERPLSDFDVIAFSTSFEPDYLSIPLILDVASIPLFSSARTGAEPLIIGGGAAFFINPEPVADFFDIICIGEGESLIPLLFSELTRRSSETRESLLKRLGSIPGVYIPSSAIGAECDDNTGKNCLSPVRRLSADLDTTTPASTVILTEKCEFGDMFLVEVSRGCPRGCRFCTSAFIYSPFRQHRLEPLLQLAKEGISQGKKIGLVGAAVSDYAGIGELCRKIVEAGGRVSVSSLRIDRLDDEMIDALVKSGHKTISLAPEGGSQRLRDLMRKNLTEEQIISASTLLFSRGILNLKLYFIIGLPTETDDDIRELLRLVHAIREKLLQEAKTRGRIGKITISVNPFIPKPFTPFQWCGMEPLETLGKKFRILEKEIRKAPNLKLKMESLKGAYLQAVLSRGDRSLSRLIATMAAGENLKRGAEKHGIDTDRIAHGSMGLNEPLPWDKIVSADKELLGREFENALSRVQTDE